MKARTKALENLMALTEPALLYKKLRNGQLLSVVSNDTPNWLCALNPWIAFAKANAYGALGDIERARRYIRLLGAVWPLPFLKREIAKYLGRTQPALVRELLGPLNPDNQMRLAFELVAGVPPASFGFAGFKHGSSALDVLWCNRLAPAAVDRVASVNQLLQSGGCSAVAWAADEPFKLRYAPFSDPCAAPDKKKEVLVTVLVTAYNCGMYVRQSVESLLAQTHTRIQIMVANDASTDDTQAQLSTLATADARLRVFNLPENVGTYAAKSLMLQFAEGEYVVCHDSDDLADPTFIAKSLAALVADSSKVAVISSWFRLDEELRIFPGAVRRFWPLLSINHSSLMLRTAVLKDLGGWDVPRVAADTELFERLRTIYGSRAVLQLTSPLTIGSLRADSLMNDAQVGAMQAAAFRRRVEYRESWVAWHTRCKKKGIKLVMASPFDDARPFAVPAEFKVCPEAIARCFRAMEASEPTLTVPE